MKSPTRALLNPLNLMKTTLTLEVGKVKLKKVGFTRSMQDMLQNLTIYFPLSRHVQLRLVKASVGNLRWVMEARGIPMTYYVKMDYGRGDFSSKMVGRREAITRLTLTQGAMIFHLRTVLLPKPSQLMRQKYDMGIFEQPVDGEWIIVEVMQLMKGTATLDSVLRRAVLKENKLHGRRVTCFRERYVTLAKKLAQKLHQIHVTPHQNRQPLGADKRSRKVLRRQDYRSALNDIFFRIGIYAPINQTHSTMGRKGRERFRGAMEKFLRGWKGKSNRLCLVHGDPNPYNVMVRRPRAGTVWPEITFIDFSPRVRIGEPRWDDGRLIFELFELYLKTDSCLVKGFIQSFIDASMSLTRDPLYLQGLCFGVYAITLLQLYPAGRPIRDKRLARVYFEHALRILEQGFFSFE